jgi:hypothetical protein
MNNLNGKFCSLLFIEVKKHLLKLLPKEALNGCCVNKLSYRTYEVFIPKNSWFPKNFVLTIKAESAIESKSYAYSHIINRIENKKFEDKYNPIVLIY